ncbi:MAG: MaoC family dehydratase N-terminal domain-containing protein [Deltaproteobacteria bacterium]|nr:MaoC family dehydratase N-terminal domain-containing protein [Deltaproteobacteria bacterium]
MLDRRVIGKNYPPALNEVERGAIRRFAESIGDPNPIYREEEAAKAAGYHSIVAPPTFPATFSGGVDFLSVLSINPRHVLIGEQSFEYHQPVCAGDRLTVTSRVVDIYEKMGTGGVMDFAVVEDEGRDEKGELVYRARKTIIVRPPTRTPEAGGDSAPQAPSA